MPLKGFQLSKKSKILIILMAVFLLDFMFRSLEIKKIYDARLDVNNVYKVMNSYPTNEINEQLYRNAANGSTEAREKLKNYADFMNEQGTELLLISSELDRMFIFSWHIKAKRAQNDYLIAVKESAKYSTNIEFTGDSLKFPDYPSIALTKLAEKSMTEAVPFIDIFRLRSYFEE